MKDGAPNRFGSEQKRVGTPVSHMEELTLYGKEAGWLLASY